MLTINFKRLRDTSRLPTKGSLEAAGWDVYADEMTHLYPGERRLVQLGIASEIPVGWMGLLRPRSGLCRDGFGMMGSGVIDSDYRGEWLFSAINLGHDWDIAIGDRIAQVVFLPVPDTQIVEVADLSVTARGLGGYGSTGLR